MVRRNATTLTEVLIAIFIMGIGLMAILALFPLGAVQMAQALKDQRAAEAAANAASMARIIWKQACEADAAYTYAVGTTHALFRAPINPADTNPEKRQYPRAIQRFVYAMDDPNFNDVAGTTPNSASYPGSPVPIPPGPTAVPGGFSFSPAPGSAAVTQYTDMIPTPLSGPLANQSSYPVLVDMFGWINGSTPNDQCWVAHGATPLPQPFAAGGSKTGAIPRRPLYQRDPSSPVALLQDWVNLRSLPLPQLRILKQFSLMDDVSFNFDGTPDLDNNPQTSATSNPPEAGTKLDRIGRYSWAYLLRRPRNKDFRSEVDVSVIVYSGRSIDVPTDEQQFYALSQPASLISGSRTVRLAYPAGNKPGLRRGQWVMDATMFKYDTSSGQGLPFPQGRFYRVVNADDGLPTTSQDNIPLPIGSPTLSIEVQSEIAFGPDPDASGRQNPRIFVVMANVVEVFQIGFVSPNTPPRNILDDHEY